MEYFFDHYGLYDVSIRVPLIIYHPNLPGGKRVKPLVQHVDILPTILDLAGVKQNYSLDGYSLMPLINEEVDKIRDLIIVETAYGQRKVGMRTLNSKYILDPNENLERELYNLSIDPKEENNLAKIKSGVIKDFDKLLLMEREKVKRRSVVKLKSEAKKLKSKLRNKK